jgi:RHS repeat-associated protein
LGSKTGLSQSFTYDANGNRLTQGGTASSAYTVSSTSNRLSSVSGALTRTYGYDAASNSTSYASLTFAYNNAGRMKSSTTGAVTTSYLYNALGQRVRKSGGGAGTVLYSYDEAGHLLGEYDSAGNLIQETVWLGDIPVATLRPGSPVAIDYVHTDHLNTPRKITRPSDDAVLWRWDSDPFGTTAPNENPQGLGTFSYNLRYPGQYFDVESGLSYNYFRDYDQSTGRYIESDPIGLDGGSYSTYAYANSNPLNNWDETGEVVSGPYHLPPKTRLRCTTDDGCAVLRTKMWVFMRLINSHQLWDWLNPPPRGGGRHAKEIADFWRGYARCQELHRLKCENCPPRAPGVPVPLPEWIPVPTTPIEPVIPFEPIFVP